MAKVGSRRHDMDLLYNMRLFNPGLKSIKEGRATLSREVVVNLEKYAQYDVKYKNFLSDGHHDFVTKAVTPYIRKARNAYQKETYKKVQRIDQIKAIFGAKFFQAEIYIELSAKMSGFGFKKIEYDTIWGY